MNTTETVDEVPCGNTVAIGVDKYLTTDPRFSLHHPRDSMAAVVRVLLETKEKEL
jgi:hypothetical protein